MKRLIALLLIAAVLFTLAACGKKSDSVAVHDSIQTATEAAGFPLTFAPAEKNARCSTASSAPAGCP